ncbi:sugar ABC transporter ATP-binding protein [Spirosoma montaniterrae]|uniref:Sugar ABC transporter ATP-binding protein n=1 Tax=Spirosoma montaniterrae TaxID=1178516 RepID=A0A1P9WV63_9BACT|nr:sugar ABC transporter ATP-binding protein [Spirosoma montaniterrae]AQG79243.1 sugar ABC transporter ATP-binding protein [Spirosoma montaniterrae]
MLIISQISKSFPGVRALSDVSLTVEAGEVHAVCGENGAGKSTLMNLLAGNLQPDTGELIWQGESIRITSPQQARQLGIGIVYQERSLVDTLSVAENLFPDQQPRSRWGLIDYPALHRQTAELLTRLRLTDLRPQTLVGRLSPGQKQMVELAKALATNPKLLILDEPTASITDREIDTLFGIIRDLQHRGVGIIYISHRMAEIARIADRVSVLKDGRMQGTFDARTTPIEQLVRLMVGRDLVTADYQSFATDTVVLEARNLSGRKFHAIDFQLHRGEILGLAGLVGAGRTELAKAIFGEEVITAGQLLKNGQPIAPKHPAEAVALGIAYVPEERKSQGIFAEMSVEENIVVAQQATVWHRTAEAHQTATHFVQQLGIRTPSIRQPVGKLSGGNQQKVVLARWLSLRPDVLLVDEPTHGVDVGAKADIYDLLRRLAANGTAILLISSELPELLRLADRVLVLHEGRLCATLPRADATEETIMYHASGS